MTWIIERCGFQQLEKAIEIYNDKRIDAILDYTYDKISKKDYSGCAEQFIKYATYFAKKEKKWRRYNNIYIKDDKKFFDM